MDRYARLIKEAGILSERINNARFMGDLPSASDTVRLCEILDILGDCNE
jgi:hypothetical protein